MVEGCAQELFGRRWEDAASIPKGQSHQKNPIEKICIVEYRPSLAFAMTHLG